MRHATDADLDALESLLDELRAVDGLRERKRGNFTRKSRAFLHFHEHDGAYYADVRLADDFERLPVTTTRDQRSLLAAVRRVVR